MLSLSPTLVSGMLKSTISRFPSWSMPVATLVAVLACAACATISVQNADLPWVVGTHAGREALSVNPDTVAGDSGSVRIMTWNIRCNTPGDGIHAWPQRRDEFLSFLLSQQPDIICIQEGLPDQVAFLKDGLRGFDMRGVGRDDGKGKGEHSAIYFERARFVSAAGGTFWLSPTPSVPGKGWDAALPRIVTWVRLVDSSTASILYVFNTHFDHIGTEARENSARLLRSKIGEIAGGSPVVVTGDFNVCRAVSQTRRFKSSHTRTQAGVCSQSAGCPPRGGI
jgi:endonuclease/exonuclease/phosphatase family metal-dependent hydrolase